MKKTHSAKVLFILGIILVLFTIQTTAVDWTGFPVNNGDVLTANIMNRLMSNVMNLTDYIHSDAAGNIGIRTLNPGAPLEVQHNRSNEGGSNLIVDLDLSGNINGGDKYVEGIFIDIDSTSIDTSVGAQRQYIRGIISDIYITGRTFHTTGIGGGVTNDGPNTLPSVNGLHGSVYNKNSGSITNAIGSSGAAWNAAGNITYAYGGHFSVFQNAPVGTIDHAKGVAGFIGGVSMLPEGIAVYGNCADSLTCYGLYIQAGDVQVPANEDWGVYVTQEDRNYFSGNVGIGTLTPGEKLDINGTMHLTPQTTPPATADEGDIYSDTSHALCWYDGTVWHKIAGAGTCT